MGATNFHCEANGTTISDAFRQAIENARWEYGHRGYTGSIAEKSGVTEFRIPLDSLPELPDKGHRNQSFAMRVDGAMCFLCEYSDDTEIDEALSEDIQSEWSKQAQADARALREAMGRKEFRRMMDIWYEKWGNAVGFRIDEGMYGFCGTASC
jgi:hypothetical protein